MGMKRRCELCSIVATIYCESDQATLCYECDSKVHSANFLVAKHSRCILCHVCQSPTLRMGSGPKVGPAISLCHTCLSSNHRGHHVVRRSVHNGDHLDDYGDDDGHHHGSGDDDDEDDDGDGDDDDGFEEDESLMGDDDDNDNDEDEDDDESEDDEENQVVPWSYSVSHPR